MRNSRAKAMRRDARKVAVESNLSREVQYRDVQVERTFKGYPVGTSTYREITPNCERYVYNMMKKGRV